jgi:hypothetical protein
MMSRHNLKADRLPLNLPMMVPPLHTLQQMQGYIIKNREYRTPGLIPNGGPSGIVPKLLFEEKGLLPNLQQLLTSHPRPKMGTGNTLEINPLLA